MPVLPTQRFESRPKAMADGQDVSAGRWVFRADIVPQARSAYDDARNSYIEQLVADLAPLAVYEYGRVGAPGISDIDLLVVVDPERSVRKVKPPVLDSSGRYLIDKPILLSPNAFRNLRRLIFVDPLDPLYGQTSTPIEVPDEEARILSAALFIDFSHILLHRFNKMRFVRRLSIRNTLLRLNSIHHSARVAERCGAAVGQDVKSLLAAVHDLRSNWFERPQYDVAADLLEQAVPVLLQLFDAVDRAADEQGWCRNQGPLNNPPTVQIAPTSFSLFSPYFVRFNDGQTQAGMSGPTFSIGWSSYNFSGSILCLPLFAYLHLHACANGRGTISRMIRRRLGSDDESGALSGLYQRVIAERMELASECWDFLDLRNLFGLGQFPSCGMVQEFVRPSSPKAMLAAHIPGRIIAWASRALAQRELRSAVNRLSGMSRSSGASGLR